MRFSCVAAVAALLGVASASNVFGSFKRTFTDASKPRTLAAGDWDELPVVPEACLLAVEDVVQCWANSDPPAGPGSPPQGANCCPSMLIFYEQCTPSPGGAYNAMTTLAQVSPTLMAVSGWRNAVWDLVGSCPYQGVTSATCAAAVDAVNTDCNIAGGAGSSTGSGSGAAPALACCAAVRNVVPNCLGTPQFQEDNFMKSIMMTSAISGACPAFPEFLCAAAVMSTARCVSTSIGNLSSCCFEEKKMGMFCINHDMSTLGLPIPASVSNVFGSAEFVNMCESHGGSANTCDPAAIIPGLFWYNNQLVTNQLATALLNTTSMQFLVAHVDKNMEMFYLADPSKLPPVAGSGFGRADASCMFGGSDSGSGSGSRPSV